MKEVLLIIILSLLAKTINGQTRKELEEQRNKTLEEIGYVDNMIKETEKQKTSGTNNIKIISNKLNLREKVLTGFKDEIGLINDRIELNGLAIKLMESDLNDLRLQYAETIIKSYKAEKRYPEIAYLLSSRDFNQGYRRLKYLQQMAKFRREEAEIIMELKEQIDASKRKMEEDLINVSELKDKEEKQKLLLQQEQGRIKRLVGNLSNKQRQLQKDLEEKKKIAQKIETEINRIIEEERRKSVNYEMTPEMKLIGENFTENKGRLPWPVEKGIITEKFGPQDHPVLTNVKQDNPGIEITSMGRTIARSVFKGQVVRVFAIQGANLSIIIKHGRYYSVYQNLVNVKVIKNDMVDTKQEIGEVYCETNNGSTSILKFMIFEDKEKVDPEIWITKK